MNHVFNNSIDDEVRGAGNRNFAGSSHAANPAGIGHTGSTEDRLMNPLNCATCRWGISLSDKVE